MTSLKLAVTARSLSRHQAVLIVFVPTAATIKVAHYPRARCRYQRHTKKPTVLP